MSIPYTTHEDDLLRKYRPDYTTAQVSELLSSEGFSRSPDSVRHRCAALKLNGPAKKLRPIGEEAKKINDAIKSIFGTTVSKTPVRKAPAILKGGRKILSLSDWHIPFHQPELIKQAIKDHSDADVLVINGDFLDMYAASSFSKYKNIPLLKEYQVGMQYLIEFSKQFPEIHLVSGNHEERLTKYFQKMVSLEVSSLVCTDVLARMANGEEYNHDGTIKQHHNFDNVFYNSRTKFYTTVGKTLFVHPSKYKSKPGETVQACAQYFYGRFPFDSVVVGHTHQCGTFHYKSHLLIEQGCLCKALEYQVSPELTYGAQNNAYAVIHQDKDGNTDKRRSGHVWCDSLPKMNE